MNISNNFTSDEWKTLVDTPVTVGKAMILASPSGPIGIMQEVTTLSNSLKEIASRSSVSPLLGELAPQLQNRVDVVKDVGNTLASELQAIAKKPTNDSRALALDACRRTAFILNKATPTDAVAYKQFVLSLAQKMAEAAKEGGFMGIGGTPVSEAEQALINDLIGALDARR